MSMTETGAMMVCESVCSTRKQTGAIQGGQIPGKPPLIAATMFHTACRSTWFFHVAFLRSYHTAILGLLQQLLCHKQESKQSNAGGLSIYDLLLIISAVITSNFPRMRRPRAVSALLAVCAKYGCHPSVLRSGFLRFPITT